MDVNEILDWCEEMIEKYNIVDEDVAILQKIINNIEEDDLYGTEYKEDEIDISEEPEE